MPTLPACELASARILLSMPNDTRSYVQRVTGRRNRLLAIALWERDGGLCGRCGLEIDPTLHGYLPGALTIGHIDPLSRGGDNGSHNLRPEHRRCNLSAGNRPDRPEARYVIP